MKLMRYPLVALALLSLSVLAAEPIESDWLELVKGYKGATMGAEVMAVEEGESADTQKVTIAIPKEAIGDPNTIEEVLVVGRMPDKPEPPQPIPVTFEWVDDYDNDNYGLVIRLGKGNWPIRLFMNSDAGFAR
jgi:hypothetical protein